MADPDAPPVAGARSARFSQPQDPRALQRENERLVAALELAESRRLRADERAGRLARLLAVEQRKATEAEATAYQAVERADDLSRWQRAVLLAGPVERARLLREERRGT